MVDSGTCFDLVSAKDLDQEDLTPYMRSCDPVRLSTASGKTKTDQCVKVYIDALGESASALLLPDCPSVLFYP